MVEAMAAGKIVIGSTSGAIPEVIGDAGLIFTENDSEDLAVKLRTALGMSGEEKEAFIQRARARAGKVYSWKRFAEQSGEALEWVVEKQRRAVR
jgi:glycosyltransferase involved in cell wall biosynthesis